MFDAPISHELAHAGDHGRVKSLRSGAQGWRTPQPCRRSAQPYFSRSSNSGGAQGHCTAGCSGLLARAFSMRSSSRTMTASSVSISDMRFWLMGTVTLPGWVAATALATAKGLPRISVPWGIASFSKRDTRLLSHGTMESAATISIIDAGSSVSPRLGLTSLQAPA
jgi:hypothetical protein